jgi:hypothetical protein
MNNTLTVPSPAQLAKDCEPLNRLEKELVKFEPVRCPVEHFFTRDEDGKVTSYGRKIFMPASKPPLFTVITTQIHKTENFFFVLSGELDVWEETTGWVRIKAPYHGITTIGTRRALRIIKDCVWITTHATNKEDVDEILKDLIEPHNEDQAHSDWLAKHGLKPLIGGRK